MASVAVGYGWMQQEGADDAFERLFIAEYSRVVTVAYRIVNDADEAEDVAQEVFADFYGRYPADAQFAPAWLYRAAVHTSLNALRGKRRRSRREATHERDAGTLSAIRTHSPDPLRAVELLETQREVRVALARLPEKSAAILALRYSGLSYAEVASTLGIKINQIGTLLRRAEIALRKEIDRETSR